MSRKLLRKIPACWTFITTGATLVPAHFPFYMLNQIPWLLPTGLNSVLLLPSVRADGAMYMISDVIRHKLGAGMRRQDTNTSGHTP